MSAFKDHFFQTQDGLRLYARDYPGPGNNAPVVLCLHGLTRNSRDFQELSPELADYDPRIAEPLAAENDDTEADALWSLFAAMSTESGVTEAICEFLTA